MKPARQVVTRSPKRNVGRINCNWFQSRPIEHESRLEKHFLLRAMLCPGLLNIDHQPFRLALKEPGNHYTPDFLLTFVNGDRVVVEVKRSEQIKALKNRFNQISDLLQRSGLAFMVIHQGQIEGQRQAERAALLRRYAMLRFPDEIKESVTQWLQDKPKGVPIGQVMRKFKLKETQIFHMAARRYITPVPKLLLSQDDLVFPVNKEIKNAAFQFGSWFGCSPWCTAA